MGQEMGKGDDVTTLPLLQQPLPACLVLLVKPLCYAKGPEHSLSCTSEALCILTNVCKKCFVLCCLVWTALLKPTKTLVPRAVAVSHKACLKTDSNDGHGQYPCMTAGNNQSNRCVEAPFKL